MAIFRLTDWQQTCKQLYFGMRLVYGGGGLGLDRGTRSRVCWVGRVIWVHGYYCAGLSQHNSTHALHNSTHASHNSTHALHNSTHAPHNSTHAPHNSTHAPTCTPCLQVCCQSINLKMAIRAETCSWYLCNKQHISNHQTVVFDSWLIQL